MQLEFIVNGGVSILLSPENVMEEELLKQMMKQENDLQEIRTSVTVLSKTFKNGLLIGKKSPTKKDDKVETDTSHKTDDSAEKVV